MLPEGRPYMQLALKDLLNEWVEQISKDSTEPDLLNFIKWLNKK